MILWGDSSDYNSRHHVYGPGDDNYGRDRVGNMDERERGFCHNMLKVIVRDEIPFLGQREKELSPEEFALEIQRIWSEYIKWIVWSNKNIPKDIREEFIELLFTDIKLNINWHDIPKELTGVANKLVEVMQATYELYKIEKTQGIKRQKGKEQELFNLLYRFERFNNKKSV